MTLSEFLQGSDGVEVTGPCILTSFELLGVTIELTETVVISWIIIVLIIAFLAWLTNGMTTKRISKRQVIAEWIVQTVRKLVCDTMGEKKRAFEPYIASLFTFSIIGSLVSIFGLRSVTADYNVPLAWALVTFILIESTGIRTKGIGGYLKGFANPLNLVSEIATPVSMSVRHFGNIASGMIITALLYYALSTITSGIGVAFLTIGIPAVLSLYFDFFSSFMQAFIFVMLTMANIANADGSAES